MGAIQHGGAKAMQDLQHGREFTGLAYDKQQEVQAEYDAHGPGALITQNAIRMQTVQLLYYDAIMKAGNDLDLTRLESLLKTWGWIANSATRTLELDHKLNKRSETYDIEAELAQYRMPRGEVDDAPDN